MATVTLHGICTIQSNATNLAKLGPGMSAQQPHWLRFRGHGTSAGDLLREFQIARAPVPIVAMVLELDLGLVAHEPKSLSPNRIGISIPGPGDTAIAQLHVHTGSWEEPILRYHVAFLLGRLLQDSHLYYGRTHWFDSPFEAVDYFGALANVFACEILCPRWLLPRTLRPTLQNVATNFGVPRALAARAPWVLAP